MKVEVSKVSAGKDLIRKQNTMTIVEREPEEQNEAQTLMKVKQVTKESNTSNPQRKCVTATETEKSQMKPKSQARNRSNAVNVKGHMHHFNKCLFYA